jgi:transcriptional regulator with XRE-family HTH domain
MSQKKRYREVSQMVRETSESPEFAESFEKRLAGRQVIKELLTMRTRHGISQEEVAKSLNCTQSRVSKIESGNDEDLRLGDILRYADAAGFQAQIVFFKKDLTLVDDVKYHFFETKALLDKLATIANVDEAIAKGVAHFFGEVGFNFVKMIFDKAKALPQEAREDVPLIRLVCDADNEQKKLDCTKVKNGSAHGAAHMI